MYSLVRNNLYLKNYSPSKNIVFYEGAVTFFVFTIF